MRCFRQMALMYRLPAVLVPRRDCWQPKHHRSTASCLTGDQTVRTVATWFRDACPATPVIAITLQDDPEGIANALIHGAVFALPATGLTQSALPALLKRAIAQRATKDADRAERSAQRLAAVGQLAAGVAHEINNQLGTLRMTIELLQDHATTPATKKYGNKALKVIGRSAHLATRLDALFSQGGTMPGEVRLQDLFETLAPLSWSLAPDKIALTVEEADPTLTVFCDPGQLTNAVLGLILNAADAARARGGNGSVSLRAARKGKQTCILVGQEGNLWREETLALARGFARDNGGSLSVSTMSATGTVATIVLPQPDAKRPDADPNGPKGALPLRQPGHVLLVEDNFPLATQTKEVLEKRGFVVTLSRGGPDALHALDGGDRYDLLVTDINMRDMNGFELADKIKDLRPEIGVIYLTGDAEDPANAGTMRHGPVLQKPVEPVLLIARITEQIAHKAQA